jgi:RNA polymerase sigma factor (sigma-70 family)
LFGAKHTDEQLVKGCVANERYWQEHFYRRFFPTMMDMCMRYATDREEAMTIVNDGMLRVFKKIHLYAFKGSLEGWVRRLVWHSLADYYRDKKKYVHFLVFEERDSAVQSTPTQQLYAEDILKMVGKLPRATQEVFRLYAIEGYTHAEIGEEMGISDGTSKWHLSNARQKLKEMMAVQDSREMKKFGN